MNTSPTTWVTRALWLTLPLTLGDLLASALEDRSTPIVVAVSVLAWTVWAAGLLASLVLRPAALTALRMLAPLPLVAGVAAATTEAPGTLGWVGLGTAAVVAVAAMSAEVGADFIDGASYGDERRFGLRPPGALLLGPLPLVWALATLPIVAGVLALAARQWLLGTVLVVFGVASAWWGVRVLHRLARRCIVFVPAGLTLVDEIVLADPVLVRRGDVVRLGAAPVDLPATDLSASSLGLILRIDVDPAVSITPAAPRGGTTEATDASAMLVAPSRPGALLAFAESRELAVARG